MPTKKSGRALPSSPRKEVEPQFPSRGAAGAVKGKAKPKRKPKPKAAPSPKADHRGTPKGKGVVKANGGKIGNPPFEATDEQRVTVRAMIAGGAQQWVVAHYLNISEDTLTRHFRLELDHGKLLVDGKIGGSIAQKALEGDADMAKFYMRTRGGWSEKHRLAVGGDADAPPIAHEVSPAWDLSGLSRKELKQMKRLAAKARVCDAASAD